MEGIRYIFLNYGVYFSKYGLISLLTGHALKRNLDFPLWTVKNQGILLVEFSLGEQNFSSLTLYYL